MKFYIKFLFAIIFLVVGNFAPLNADAFHELNNHLSSTTTQESISYSTDGSCASFNISSLPTNKKKSIPEKDAAEKEEVEEENESNSSKKYLEDIHQVTSLLYSQLLKQFFICSNNRLSIIKLCPYISPEYHYLLFQVFRI